MKPIHLRRYWKLLVAAGLLAVGGYVLRDQWADQPGGLAATEAAPPASPPEVDASLPETIAFPRDRWESAGLRVQAAAQEALTEEIELTGKVALNDDRLAHIFPLVEGRVDEVRVRLGQRVKKDDLLVVVQSKEVGQGMLQLFQDRLKLQLAEIRDRWTQNVGQNTRSMIDLMRAGATIESIEQALKDRPLGDYRQDLMTAYVTHLKARAHLERLSPLSSSGAVPARQIIEAEAEVTAARATLQSLWEQSSQDVIQASQLSAQAVKDLQTSISVAETNLKILGLADQDLQEIDPAVKGEQLSHYPVTAPFDGTVVSKDVVLLERVGPEQQILTIADLATVWITADIYEAHLPLLSQLNEQMLRVRCEAWPDQEFAARIFYTGDVVQESTRTISLRATAANPDGLLKPGMFVTVILPSLHTGAVLQVPSSAIQDHAGHTFVFVHTGDETFTRRDVVTARHSPGQVEIRAGLRAGERVVVEGGFALKSKLLAALLAE